MKLLGLIIAAVAARRRDEQLRSAPVWVWRDVHLARETRLAAERRLLEAEIERARARGEA